MEHFTSFNLIAIMRESIPGYDPYESLQTKGYREIFRAGFSRAAGIDGNSVRAHLEKVGER